MKCAFKLDRTDGLSSIREFIEDNSIKFQSKAEKIWARMVAIDACRLFDFKTYNATNTTDNCVANAYDMLCNDLMSAYEKKVRTQIDVEMQLFFQKSNIDSEIYGLYIINNDELYNDFIGLESISKIEDNTHVDIWDDIFKINKNPNTAMLSVNLVPCGAVELNMDLILSSVPNLHERAQFLAESIAVDDFKNNAVNDFTSMEEVWNYLASEAHLKTVKKLCKKIKKKITKHVTKTQLTN